MPKLVLKLGGRVLQNYDLKPGVNRFGRALANDCRLEDASVSGYHCEIVFENGTVLVRDLDSTNGTYLDGKLTKESVFLTGQTLKIGLIEIGLDGPPAHVAVQPLPLPDQGPVPTLMTDGTPCCLNHPGVRASLACEQCAQFYCESCARHLRVVGKPMRAFCPACSGICSPCSPLKAPSGLQNILVKSIVTGLKRTFQIFTRPPRSRSRRK